LQILCIGAHPDDCEIEFGGTAAKFAGAGHSVKFLSVTNGAAGHHTHFGPGLVEVRRKEARLAAERLGIAASEVLGAPDGALQPELRWREEIIRQIRDWDADVVLTHRSCDYHPDHRYTGQLVQDAAYLVQVPAICPDEPPLRRNPVFVYLEDHFQLPNPFQPDVAVNIDDVWCTKIAAMDAHASQFYEWLPWVDGQEQEVPGDGEARRQWLSAHWTKSISSAVRAALAARYGAGADRVVHAEAFQLCEYGRRPSRAELNEIFPV
jgi:LmbE family N-acetylglucosaminyl deacetylase